MGNISNLGVGLMVVFCLLIFVILCQFVHVIYWRKKYRQETIGVADPCQNLFTGNSSKELMFFFCWKNHSVTNPNLIRPRQEETTPSVSLDSRNMVIRLGSYVDSRTPTTRYEDESGKSPVTGNSISTPIDVEIGTPFSTPCLSPSSFTPTSSPLNSVAARTRTQS